MATAVVAGRKTPRPRGRGDRSDSGTLLQRQWAVLQMLPREPRAIDTPTLAARLETEHGITVLARTLQRELLGLTTIFPIAVNETEKPYRWSWSSSAPTLSLPLVDPKAALLLLLVERHLRQALPPALSESLEPLVHVARAALASEKNKLGTWLKSVRVISRHLALEPPAVPRGVLAAVSEALLEQRKVRLQYTGKKPGEKAHLVSPLGLVLKDGVGYVVGVVDGYDDIRTFALHRTRRAEIQQERRGGPKGFDIDRYIRDGAFGYRLGDDLVLKARFSKDVARNVVEGALSSEQAVKNSDDGSVVLTARVADTQQLRSWLLGFGPHAEILEPAALRTWAANAARRTAALYADVVASADG